MKQDHASNRVGDMSDAKGQKICKLDENLTQGGKRREKTHFCVQCVLWIFFCSVILLYSSNTRLQNESLYFFWVLNKIWNQTVRLIKSWLIWRISTENWFRLDKQIPWCLQVSEPQVKHTDSPQLVPTNLPVTSESLQVVRMLIMCKRRL